MDQKMIQELRAREGQVRRLHKNIKDYKLNDHQRKILELNKSQLQNIVQYKYKASPINQAYNFPKLSISSSQLSAPQSLQGSTYNLFQQNLQGKRCDQILYPHQIQKADIQNFKRKQRQFLQCSKQSIRKKKQQFQQRKKQYDNLLNQRKNQTHTFQPGQLLQFQQQDIAPPTKKKKTQPNRKVITQNNNISNKVMTNDQYLLTLIKNFRVKQKQLYKEKQKSIKSNSNRLKTELFLNKTDKYDIKQLNRSKSKKADPIRERIATEYSNASKTLRSNNPGKITKENNNYSIHDNKQTKDNSLRFIKKNQTKQLNTYISAVKKAKKVLTDQTVRALNVNQFSTGKLQQHQHKDFSRCKLQTADVSAQLKKINERKGLCIGKKDCSRAVAISSRSSNITTNNNKSRNYK